MKTIYELCTLRPEHAKEWMDRNERCMSPHIATVPPTLKAPCPRLYFPRECFFRAVQFVALNPQLPQATFVYGEASSGGLQQHGWAEIDDVVFDGVMQEFHTKSGYYRVNCARVWYRYTRDAVMFMRRIMRRGGKYDMWDWHNILSLPSAKSAQDPTIKPLVIDADAARRFLTAAERKH